jgi:hypothetical protein
MSNLSLTVNSKPIEKIIIKDDSDDSFNPECSNILSNEKNILKPKKSLISKINSNNENDKVIGKNKSGNHPRTKVNFNYKKNNVLNNKTKEILEKSFNDYQNAMEKYYSDVLEWMNTLYSDDSKSIMKIRLKKITLNEDIFNTYNSIIKKYKLDKDLFDTENFDIEEFHDGNQLFKIAKIMTNNLLEKLGYKLDVYKVGDSKKYKINNITNGI